MSAPPSVSPKQRLPPGHARFVRYAFPPNELGYCGPADSAALLRSDDPREISCYAKKFDGTWPYLRALADAAGIPDALDEHVVRSYWVGGPLLARPDPAALLAALRSSFAGQLTGLLDQLTDARGVLAHHSFHVLVVYPWVRFLDRSTDTALPVLQNCRIRWGTVRSVAEEHLVLSTSPLTFNSRAFNGRAFNGRALALGDPVTERVRWRRHGVSLIPAPRPDDIVAAHWDWACDTLTADEAAALATATHTTLELVNSQRANTLQERWRSDEHLR